jgi:dTDP-4-dehydrorhamnose 3,5-epimerase-like enzyme
MGVEDCKEIELPAVANPLGTLAFAEGESHIPFPIARVFYVYDVPEHASRGGHAHRTLEEVVFCLGGQMEIAVDDGRQRRTFGLANPRRGLYLPPMVWYDIGSFSPGTVYLAFASREFEESDYIRHRDEFQRLAQAAV